MKLKKTIKRILLVLFVLFSIFLIAFSGLCIKIINEAPEIYPRQKYEEIKTNKKNFVEYKDVPKDIIDAFVAVEDHRFYNHHGIDYIRVFGAIWYDIRHFGLYQGASTISMQVSKICFTSFDKTFKRKIIDFYYATRLEKDLSKDEILEIYVNSVGLSRGVEGIYDAGYKFFNKKLSDLSLAESALIAGVTNWPREYTPYLVDKIEKEDINKNLKPIFSVNEDDGVEKDEIKIAEILFEEKIISEDEYNDLISGNKKVWKYFFNIKSKYRQEYVLKKMLKYKKINEENYNKALNETIQLNVSRNV